MEELDYILNQRKIIQQEYLKQSKNIWTEFDGEEADRKHKKIYSSYRNEDYFLEGLQVRLEDIIKELENYKCI